MTSADKHIYRWTKMLKFALSIRLKGTIYLFSLSSWDVWKILSKKNIEVKKEKKHRNINKWGVHS